MNLPWISITISLRVGAIATALVLLPGWLLAWLLVYGHFPGRRILDVAVHLPLALPPTVIGYYLLVLLGPRGPLGAGAHMLGYESLILTPAAAVIAAAVVSLPLMVQANRLALEAIPKEVVETAQTDGACSWRVIWHIYVPNAWPGICTGMLLCFIRALGEFGATIMVAGNIPGKTQTMAIAIYSAAQAGHLTEAHMLAGLLAAIATCSLWVGLSCRQALFSPSAPYTHRLKWRSPFR